MEIVWKIFFCVLTAPLFKNSQFFLLKFTLFLSKNVLDKTLKAFNTKFGPQWKDIKSSCQVEQMP